MGFLPESSRSQKSTFFPLCGLRTARLVVYTKSTTLKRSLGQTPKKIFQIELSKMLFPASLRDEIKIVTKTLPKLSNMK